MSWLWIAGPLLLAIAGLAVWRAFRNPAFVAGITAIAVKAAWRALVGLKLPSAKKHFENVWKDVTPDERERLRQERRAREQRDRERRGDR